MNSESNPMQTTDNDMAAVDETKSPTKTYKPKRLKVIIAGCGLVGALNAVYFARTNRFDVVILEKRDDIRLVKHTAGRSINLSLSYRGICALKEVGLDKEVLKHAIPMRGRMIHNMNKSTKKLPYGTEDQCLYSLERKLLNEILLTFAEDSPNVEIKFETSLLNVNFKRKRITYKYHKEEIHEDYDLLIGNDGAFSNVRVELLKYVPIDFKQEYIPHGYLELYFPPDENNEYKMEKNYFHIWPRNEFMLIGLPNPEGSFTGTLFMPMDIFSQIKDEKDVIHFFRKHFPDAVDMMGEDLLLEKYNQRTPSRMISIKCDSYNYEDSCILMGDAAHAMVPFYGQGMNCGMEDVLIFHNILKENNYELKGVCQKFSAVRAKDAHAICDLAYYNYDVIRNLVNSQIFRIRLVVDGIINYFFPQKWIPLYTMVSFSQIPYSSCVRKQEYQNSVISTVNHVLMFGTVIGSVLGIWYYRFGILDNLNNIIGRKM